MKNHPKVRRPSTKKHPLERVSVVRGKTEFPGIAEDAKALGVDRTHLWRVLAGERTSARLLARYLALKAQPTAATAA